MTHLFTPLKLREITLHNRIGVAPMCQYSATDGLASDWHFVHYNSRAVGGAALIIVEATAVSPEARISLGDLGLWHDAQVAALARITQFAQQQGCAMGVQLAHAGRKAGVGLGWQAQKSLPQNAGGWQSLAPSALAFSSDYAEPKALGEAEIQAVIAQFSASARRAYAAGFSLLEIHAAHGYLLHQFLSPLANQRKDAWGGSFANRTRLVREVVSAVRRQWPERLPLLVRLSATDWAAGGWTADETVELCRQLKDLGVDLIDVSTGGLVPNVQIPVGPGFQVEFAARVKHEAALPVATVGLITSPAQADHIVRSGQADLVLLGRELLRDPYWPLRAAKEFKQSTPWPPQYLRAAPPNASSR